MNYFPAKPMGKIPCKVYGEKSLQNVWERVEDDVTAHTPPARWDCEGNSVFHEAGG